MSVIDPREQVKALLEEVSNDEQKKQLEGVLASLTDDSPAVVRHKAAIASPPPKEKKKKAATSKSSGDA